MAIIVAAVVGMIGACTPADPSGTTGTPTSTETPTTSVPHDPTKAYLYVAETNLGAIRKIDTATLETVAMLTVHGTLGESLALLGDQLFYATDRVNSHSIGMIDVRTGANDREFLPGGVYFPMLRTSPAHPGRLFIGNGTSPGQIAQFDVTAAPPTLVSVTSHGTVGSNLQDYEISQDGSRIWVASGAPYEVIEVGAADLVPTGRTYVTGAYPHAVASTSAGGTEVLAAGRGAASWESDLYLYDQANPAAVTPYQFASGGVAPRGLGFSRDGGHVFAVAMNADGAELATVTRSSGAVTRAPMVTDPYAFDHAMGELVVDPGTGRIFVSGGDALHVYNPDGSYGVTLPFAAPRGLAVSATGPTSSPPPLTTTTTTTSTTSTTTTTTVTTPRPPVISTFAASYPAGPSPLTTAFSWYISDPDGSTLTCGLDLDGNGSYEVTIASCTSESSRSATFTSTGRRVVGLRVSDGLFSVTRSVDLNIGPAWPDEFTITLRLDPALTEAQRLAFDAAAARWEQVIRHGLPDIAVNDMVHQCTTDTMVALGTVDDVLIDATVGEIDGAGGVLGEAGPCMIRTVGLPIYGAMNFDRDDLATLESSGQLQALITHELGHVLGFGTLWGSRLSGAGTSDPRFNGFVAWGAWDAIGGTEESVPVENTGGPGTADAHWRETEFGDELMTGYLGVGSSPLSAVTIGAMADLGYGVDLGAADAFGQSAARADASPGVRINTRLVVPTQRMTSWGIVGLTE